MKPTKVIFKGGGFLIVDKEEEFKAQCAMADFESYDDPTKADIKQFKEHQAFMGVGQKYIDLIEEWVEGRPPVTERFRYDSSDILNLMAFLIKKKEPAKRRVTETPTISKTEFKERLEVAPFGVIDGGKNEQV